MKFSLPEHCKKFYIHLQRQTVKRQNPPLNPFLKNVLLFMLILTIQQSHAQPVEIFGYYEPQLMGARINGEFYQLASNKLRVDLQLEASDNVHFGANFDYITYHGKTEWNLLNFLPDRILKEVPDYNILGYDFNPYILPFENRNFLDNAYVKFYFKYADLTVGKQQLSMGSGYAWNPTDLFNKKDITDPTYEQPGHNALRLDIPIGSRINITSIYAPAADWKYSDLLVKFKVRIARFDVALIAAQKHWNYSDARIFDPVKFDYYHINTKRHILGADLSGELLGLGVRAEGTYNNVSVSNKEENQYQLALGELNTISARIFQPMKIDEHFYELVVGSDYTFDFQTYVMIEYYKNTAGKNDYRNYTFNDWMQYLVAERRAINQDQIYFYSSHPLTDLINVGSSAIFSISDGSTALIPTITYNIFENVDLTAFGNFYFGKEGTIYSPDFGNGGILRARVYF